MWLLNTILYLNWALYPSSRFTGPTPSSLALYLVTISLWFNVQAGFVGLSLFSISFSALDSCLCEENHTYLFKQPDLHIHPAVCLCVGACVFVRAF